MLKSATYGATSFRAGPSTSRNLLIDSSFQTPANPPPSGSPGNWRAYIDGGAQGDDNRLLQKRREEEAAFEVARRDDTAHRAASKVQDAGTASVSGTLIETSPRKSVASVSGNTDLLIDLDISESLDGRQPQQATGSYASAARSGAKAHNGSGWSLMD